MHATTLCLVEIRKQPRRDDSLFWVSIERNQHTSQHIPNGTNQLIDHAYTIERTTISPIRPLFLSTSSTLPSLPCRTTSLGLLCLPDVSIARKKERKSASAASLACVQDARPSGFLGSFVPPDVCESKSKASSVRPQPFPPPHCSAETLVL